MTADEELVDLLLHGDENEADEAREQLIQRGSAAVSALVPHLRSRDPRERNGVALVLREIGDSSAVPPLIEAINRPENRDNIGTLIYALQTMDCREHFWTLFRLMLNENYEQSCMSYYILQQQAFAVTPEDLERARQQFGLFMTQEPKPRLPIPTSNFIAAVEEVLTAIAQRLKGS
jgi:hypothetical protein